MKLYSQLATVGIQRSHQDQRRFRDRQQANNGRKISNDLSKTYSQLCLWPEKVGQQPKICKSEL